MIGSSIIEELIKYDSEVLCIIRKGSSKEHNIPQDPKVKLLYSDISAYNDIIPEGNYDYFIHLAWDKTFGSSRDDADTQLQNIQYTLDAVRLAHRFHCKAFIGAGSQAEYGVVSVPLTPNLPVNPQSGYGIAKYTAGKLAKLLCDQLNMRFNWIRILSVYGKKDNPYTLISYVVNSLKNGISPELTKCEQIWDYINEVDAAKAFIAVAEKGITGNFYPLGSGEGRELSEYLSVIRNQINPSIELGFGNKEYYPHQPMYLVADISKLKEDTGWKPEVSFDEGIKKIWE